MQLQLLSVALAAVSMVAAAPAAPTKTPVPGCNAQYEENVMADGMMFNVSCSTQYNYHTTVSGPSILGQQNNMYRTLKQCLREYCIPQFNGSIAAVQFINDDDYGDKPQTSCTCLSAYSGTLPANSNTFFAKPAVPQ